MIKICIVAGARPNFMKIAPIIDALKSHNTASNHRIDYLLVHTGQHYDQKMSALFFDHLGIPTPDIDLGVRSGSHAVQTAEIMKKFEPVCLDYGPTHVLVVGDVNSTVACSLVAAKLDIRIVHVEAGLRSFDRKMPEEINRVLTDAISDILFTTEESANRNLIHEGIPKEKIYFVGNVMIDTLIKHKDKANQSSILRKLDLAPANDREPLPYAILTLHRPSNVDDRNLFTTILDALKDISRKIPIILPVHPRTRQRLRAFALEDRFESLSSETAGSPGSSDKNLYLCEPLGYLDFLQLMSNARIVITDSGGIQEETTILNVPCVTIRENTERPVTIEHGTNRLAGTTKSGIVDACTSALEEKADVPKPPPPLWDGRASKRIVEILAKL